MNRRERQALDRHITGNYGEDQLKHRSSDCIWEDCDQEAIYCKGHASEYAAAGQCDAADASNEIASLRNQVVKQRATIVGLRQELYIVISKIMQGDSE